METLLLLLIFPLLWPFVAKKLWNHEITWAEMAINIGGVVALVLLVWFIGTASATSDTEVWNGEIVDKKREHGQWTESYSCNCRQSCTGSGTSRSCTTTCSTCYREHYTVTWSAVADFGVKREIQLDHIDRTSRSVYNTPDPPEYTNCEVGEPAALENKYTNYVQAAPESLFNNSKAKKRFADKIPDQPRVYDHYRINRVINVDSQIAGGKVRRLNDMLNNELKTLGPKKQININVILTEIDDQNYRHAVENAWIGGEKNDVTVFIGLDGNKITWTDVMTFALNTGNEIFHVQLRDALADVGTFDAEALTAVISEKTLKHYDRINMEKFEYLKERIQPPTWVIILAAVLAVGGSIGVSILMQFVDIGGGTRTVSMARLRRKATNDRRRRAFKNRLGRR